MSSWLQNDQIVTRLKHVMKCKRVSARELSTALNIPYRTVQNYLSNESRIPADFLLNVCNYIGIEVDYFIYHDFKPRQGEMYDAVFELMEERGWLPSPMASAERSLVDFSELNAFVAVVVVTLIERYDRYRSAWLQSSVRDRMPPGRRRSDNLVETTRKAGKKAKARVGQ